MHYFRYNITCYAHNEQDKSTRTKIDGQVQDHVDSAMSNDQQTTVRVTQYIVHHILHIIWTPQLITELPLFDHITQSPRHSNKNLQIVHNVCVVVYRQYVSSFDS